MSPKATYIMPCSRPQFLSSAVQSACNQTMQEIEIIVGDSTQCFEGYPDPRVKSINTEGMKLNVAINAMIAAAASDVILILCDDDVDLPNRAQTVYNGLQTSDIFLASYNKMDINGQVFATELVWDWDYDQYVYGGLNMPLWSGGYRKSVCPVWHPDLKYMGDYGFFLESHRRDLKIKTSHDIVANIRHWYGQQSQNTPQNDAFRAQEKKIIKEIYGIDVRR